MKPPALLLRDVACTYLKYTFQLAMCDSARQPSHFGGKTPCPSMSIPVLSPSRTGPWTFVGYKNMEPFSKEPAMEMNFATYGKAGKCGQHSGTGPVNFDSLTVNVMLPLKMCWCSIAIDWNILERKWNELTTISRRHRGIWKCRSAELEVGLLEFKEPIESFKIFYIPLHFTGWLLCFPTIVIIIPN
jgi:hypothetical protein